MSTSQKVERSNFQSCIIITEMHSHKDLLHLKESSYDVLLYRKLSIS